jgi:hypothetical protein
VSCVEKVLEGVARDLQAEVQNRLRGFFGGMLRHYLPQTWVFRTEDGTATLRVDEQGAVSVTSGALAPADVTVEVGHDRLRQMLTTRSRDPNPTGPLHVTTHSAKGKAAVGFLRERLGLGPN